MIKDRQVTQVRIGGFGGQGVVLAGALLGHAAIRYGLQVSGSNSYGAQARGGSARSEVVISKQTIVFPHVLHADVFIAMNQTAYDAYSGNMSENDPVIIHDPGLVTPDNNKTVRHMPLPATDTAVSDLGNRQAANIVMLGALAAITEIVSIQALQTAVSEQLASRFREMNFQALDKGFELGGSAFHGGSPTEAKAGRESSLSLTHESCTKCDLCRLHCPEICITRNPETDRIEIDHDFCKRCGICAFICPKDAIRMESGV